MKIRLAITKDCKRCAELSRIQELKPTIGGYITSGYFKNFVDKDKMFFVAEENNQVVGYILGEPLKGKLALLGLLSVDKKVRDKGIGRQLVEKFRKRCKQKKLTYTLIYAPSFNKKTIDFYTKCGFKKGKEHVHVAETTE